jgi:2-dehydropantoate 2-reductase
MVMYTRPRFNMKQPTSVLRPRIHIVGAGAMGLLLGAKLRVRYPEYPVTLLRRRKAAANVGSNLLNVKLREGISTVCVPVPAEYIDDDSTTIKHLVVTTKAGDAAAAVQSLLPRLAPSSQILVLCNGAMGVRQEIKVSALVRLGIISHGAYRCPDDPWQVVHAGQGEILIQGHESQAWDGLIEDWDAAGLSCRSVANISPLLWRKLAVNCVINPVTAWCQCPNGALLTMDNDDAAMRLLERLQSWWSSRSSNSMQAPPTRLSELMARACQEVAAVAACALNEDGPGLAPTNDTLTAAMLLDQVHHVIMATAHNRSSMWQDLLSGRRTEVDYLNGYLVQQAQRYQLSCPVNQFLWELIRERERGHAT